MESVVAWALEDKLSYWLKSFSGDQLRLDGHTARLSNVEINGDAVHAGLGLPQALAVAAAHVEELEITLPSVLNMQVEPTVVNIDKLDIILEEKDEMGNLSSSNSNLSLPSSTKDSGYGYADKRCDLLFQIADGMTVKVGIVNLLIKTHTIAPCEGGITGSTPSVAITVHDLMLYTTNQKWQVVSLKEAMDFSNDKGFVYVFKKMNWQSLSVDLKPHANNFVNTQLNSPIGQDNRQDDDGAIQMPYVGERVFEGISGEANITIQRTEQNILLGLEFQVHIIEALCPALSKHGLLAFLSFITSLCVTLSRRDADPKQKHSGAARSSSVSIIVDHIHFRIKDTELQLELLVKSLFFSRASVPDGENRKTLSCIKVGDLVLRDTFVEPLCTLIQPSKEAIRQEPSPVPDFGQSFCSIYPFGNQLLGSAARVPFLSLYSLQLTPSPLPPKFSVETVITCSPLTMTFQEQSFLRIASLLGNGMVKNCGDAISHDSSVHSLTFSVREFDLSVILTPEEISKWYRPENSCSQSISAARLHVENLYFCRSPSANCTLLSLEKDPTSSLLWEHQPIHTSKKKWVTRASFVALETYTTLEELEMVNKGFGNRWSCIMIDGPVFEVAVATADGSSLSDVPPPEGGVRIGIHCHHYTSSITAEQLLFVLALYAYFVEVGEHVYNVNRSCRSAGSGTSHESSVEKPTKRLPSDTVMSLSMSYLDMRIKESSPFYSRDHVYFGGSLIFIKVSHHTLGSTRAVTASFKWKEASLECFNLEKPNDREYGIGSIGGYDIFTEEEPPMKKPAFWVNSQYNYQSNQAHFVIPYHQEDAECCKVKLTAKISGVSLGGGMRYAEYVLQRLDIGPDGGPGQGLLKVMSNLFSGPLAKLLSLTDKFDGSSKEDDNSKFGTGMPYDIDVSVELKDGIFALGGMEEIEEWTYPRTLDYIPREVKFWQAAFRNLHLLGKSSSETGPSSTEKSSQEIAYPFGCFTAHVEGLQAIRPHFRIPPTGNGTTQGHQAGIALASRDQGIDAEATMVISEDKNGGSRWTVDKIRFPVDDLMIGAAATKEEQEYLSALCRSEADSLGRIAVGILRLLKLDRSLGEVAIDQLANLGSGLDGIFTPEFSTH